MEGFGRFFIVVLISSVFWPASVVAQQAVNRYEIVKVAREPSGKIQFIAKNGSGKHMKRYFRFVTRDQVEAFKCWYWTVENAYQLRGKPFYGTSFGQAFHAVEYFREKMTRHERLASLLALRYWEKCDSPMPDQPDPIRLDSSCFSGHYLSPEMIDAMNRRFAPVTGGYTIFESAEMPQGVPLPSEATYAAAVRVHHKNVPGMDMIIIITDDPEKPIVYIETLDLAPLPLGGDF